MQLINMEMLLNSNLSQRDASAMARYKQYQDNLRVLERDFLTMSSSPYDRVRSLDSCHPTCLTHKRI